MYILYMYNKRMYINIMFMYIIHNISTCMFTTYDVKITVAAQSYLKRCFALTKTMPKKAFKACGMRSFRQEVGDGLRYRLLRKGYQQTAKEQQYLQYPKRDPKKDVALWLHNTACLVMFVASIILRLPFIDPETNRRKKQMKKKSEKKMFLLHPWKSTWNPKFTQLEQKNIFHPPPCFGGIQPLKRHQRSASVPTT